MYWCIDVMKHALSVCIGGFFVYIHGLLGQEDWVRVLCVLHACILLHSLSASNLIDWFEGLMWYVSAQNTFVAKYLVQKVFCAKWFSAYCFARNYSAPKFSAKKNFGAIYSALRIRHEEFGAKYLARSSVRVFLLARACIYIFGQRSFPCLWTT